ncbi:hypothetical protein MRX96_038533 [Rhipicephalus microplus]
MLRDEARSLVQGMQLVMLCRQRFVKEFGLDRVLGPLTQDLVTLEKKGLTINGGNHLVRLDFITGDNLESHTVGGLTQHFKVLALAKGKGVCGSADAKALHRGALVQRVSVKGTSITEKLPELPCTPTIIALAFEDFFVGQIYAMLSSITALIVFIEQDLLTGNLDIDDFRMLLVARLIQKN